MRSQQSQKIPGQTLKLVFSWQYTGLYDCIKTEWLMQKAETHLLLTIFPTPLPALCGKKVAGLLVRLSKTLNQGICLQPYAVGPTVYDLRFLV